MSFLDQIPFHILVANLGYLWRDPNQISFARPRRILVETFASVAETYFDYVSVSSAPGSYLWSCWTFDVTCYLWKWIWYGLRSRFLRTSLQNDSFSSGSNRIHISLRFLSTLGHQTSIIPLLFLHRIWFISWISFWLMIDEKMRDEFLLIKFDKKNFFFRCTYINIWRIFMEMLFSFQFRMLYMLRKLVSLLKNSKWVFGRKFDQLLLLYYWTLEAAGRFIRRHFCLSLWISLNDVSFFYKVKTYLYIINNNDQKLAGIQF